MEMDAESDGEPLLDARPEQVLPRVAFFSVVLLMLIACSGVAVSAQTRAPAVHSARIDAAIQKDSEEAISLLQRGAAISLLQRGAVLQTDSQAPLHAVGNFIAAWANKGDQKGTDAQKWGLWEGDPGADGRQPDTLSSNPPNWYNPLDWWIEEHGLIMPNPVPLPAGEYKVYGDTTQGGPDGAKLLTVKEDGSWELPEGVTLDQVTHHPCKSVRYMGTEESGCTVAAKAKCTDGKSPAEYKVLIVSEQTVDSATAGTLPRP